MGHSFDALMYCISLNDTVMENLRSHLTGSGAHVGSPTAQGHLHMRLIGSIGVLRRLLGQLLGDDELVQGHVSLIQGCPHLCITLLHHRIHSSMPILQANLPYPPSPCVLGFSGRVPSLPVEEKPGTAPGSVHSDDFICSSLGMPCCQSWIVTSTPCRVQQIARACVAPSCPNTFWTPETTLHD